MAIPSDAEEQVLMNFDPHAKITNRDTMRPLTEPPLDEGGERRFVTYGVIAQRALDAKFPDDQPADSFKRFLLATRIVATPVGTTIDLTIEEAKLIKDVTAKAFPPGLWGQIWMALDEAAKGSSPSGPRLVDAAANH